METETRIHKASISFRISINQWRPENRFRELLGLFAKHKRVTDEIAFFSSETHTPLQLEDARERCAMLKKRMAAVREKLNLKAGINVLATIGHHGENLPNSLAGDYTHMVDINGQVALGSFCPNDPRFCDEYLRPLYEAVADAVPDFIWIDDDIRMIGHGKNVVFTCFCDKCLQIFGRQTGAFHDREELKKLFVSGSVEDKLNIRTAWIRQNNETIKRLLGFIEKVVHKKNPDIEMGLMDGYKQYEGFGLDEWAHILSGPDHKNVRWRPGGGAGGGQYWDAILTGAHAIGREAETLPAGGVSIQSEIENFPYQRLSKSSHFTVMETCAYCAAGATGAAFNVLSMYDEPEDEYVTLVDRLEELRPFLDLIVRKTGREKTVGIYTGWTKTTAATANLHQGDEWFNCKLTFNEQFPGLVHADEIFKLGLPAAYSAENAVVTALSGESVRALSREQITKILSSAAYLDVEALVNLNEMGFQPLTGFTVKNEFEVDTIEEFRKHPLNGGFTGRQRNGRQAFFKGKAYALQAHDGQGESLTRLIDYTGQELAESGMGVYRNHLGGRICVSGYYPWSFLMNYSKSSQIKLVFLWLSGNKLPAYINSFHRVSLWCRPNPAGGTINVALLNASMDPAEKVELMLATHENSMTLYDMACRPSILTGVGQKEGYKRFIIPKMDPWNLYFLTEK